MHPIDCKRVTEKSWNITYRHAALLVWCIVLCEVCAALDVCNRLKTFAKRLQTLHTFVANVAHVFRLCTLDVYSIKTNTQDCQDSVHVKHKKCSWFCARFILTFIHAIRVSCIDIQTFYVSRTWRMQTSQQISMRPDLGQIHLSDPSRWHDMHFVCDTCKLDTNILWTPERHTCLYTAHTGAVIALELVAYESSDYVRVWGIWE